MDYYYLMGNTKLYFGGIDEPEGEFVTDKEALASKISSQDIHSVLHQFSALLPFGIEAEHMDEEIQIKLLSIVRV